jgi:hypothetical protein
VPLFLFHLLEFSGQEFDLDVEALNARWADPEFIDSWSQIVIKHTEANVDVVTQAPPTGIWKQAADGSVSYHRFDYHRAAVETEREAYFLRITGAGDHRYEGADLGILITRGRSMTDDFKLNERAHNWIKGLKSYYYGKPLEAVQETAAPAAGAFKIL